MAALAKISAMLRKKTDDMILSIFPVPFEDAIKRFLPIALKLDLFDYMLQGAWLQSKDDLFYQELDSEDWKLMSTMYSEIGIVNKKGYKKQYQKYAHQMMIGSAVESKRKEAANP